MYKVPEEWKLSDFLELSNDEKLKWLYNGVKNGGGSNLPEVTSDDNGDVLTVVDGAWAKAEPGGGGARIVKIDFSAPDYPAPPNDVEPGQPKPTISAFLFDEQLYIDNVAYISTSLFVGVIPDLITVVAGAGLGSNWNNIPITSISPSVTKVTLQPLSQEDVANLNPGDMYLTQTCDAYYIPGILESFFTSPEIYYFIPTTAQIATKE